MKETPKLRSEFWKGARRGTGMAFGVGGVVTVVTLLRDGPLSRR
jgi:hypothetical protein